MDPLDATSTKPEEETTDHLLDECSYTTKVWDWVAIVFCQMDRVKGDIRATLGNWREHFSENELVNLCWGLTSGMVIWEIWKERNRRIFKNEALPITKVVESIKNQVRETTLSRNIPPPKNHMSPQDLSILHLLQLKDWSFNIPAPRDPQIHNEAKAWTPPQEGFLKLNFDGASKGNPRKG
jgi:hypothetical protein